MENRDLLREVTYLSRLIRNRQNDLKQCLDGVGKYHEFERKDVNESNTSKSSKYVFINNSNASHGNSQSIPEFTRKTSGGCKTVHINPTSVSTNLLYINKNMLKSSPQPSSKLSNDIPQRSRGIIYYNPKFIRPVCQSQNSQNQSSPQQIRKENKIHINPSFLACQQLNSSPLGPNLKVDERTKVKPERVYVNPKFLPKSSVTTPGSSCININTSLNVKTTTAFDVGQNSDILVSKHKIIRKSNLVVSDSINLSQESKQLPSNQHKYKLVNYRKHQTRTDILTEKGSKGEPVKDEFKKSKYSIVRCKINTQNTSIGYENAFIPEKVKGALKIPVTEQRKRRRSQSVSSNAFKLVGKRKLVRRSVLQSQIVARRCLTNSKFLPGKTSFYQSQAARFKSHSFQGNPKLRFFDQPQFSKYKFVRNVHPKHRMKSHHPLKLSTGFLRKKPGKKTSNIINISGTLYSSSYNKLRKKTVKGVASSGTLIRVRGARFLLDNSGLTLKRLDRNIPGSGDIKRVDIGGHTYVKSMNGNVLKKTSVMSSRQRLKAAKQKSIAVLTAKLRKNNEPCPFYNRFGYCLRKEKGRCQRVHDKKFVSLCQKFLKGECTEENCLLSHSLIPEKMPICHHYLQGTCMRDNCPFPHIKHNYKTPICVNFLNGYCVKGTDCSKRHVFLCPVFAEKGECSKGKYCRYPHTKPRVRKTRQPKKAETKTKAHREEEKPLDENREKVSYQRYFVVSSVNELGDEIEESGTEDSEDEVVVVDDSDEESSKEKFQFLPEYVPLGDE